MRGAIAKRLTESVTTAPHFYCFETIQVPPILDRRETPRAEDKPGLNHLVLYACGRALKKCPKLNSRWAGDHIEQFESIHIGIVVALEDGLLIPVLRDVDTKDLPQIAAESKALIEKARNGELRPAETSEATFTVSNLGPTGPRAFTAIISPPQAAILAVGGGRMAAIADVSGNVTARPVFEVCLSCDHRMIDGSAAAEFLNALKHFCETTADLQ